MITRAQASANAEIFVSAGDFGHSGGLFVHIGRLQMFHMHVVKLINISGCCRLAYVNSNTPTM